MAGRPTILVAEDIPDDAFFLQQAFVHAGIQAALVFVRDGQELIQYLSGDSPFKDRVTFPLPMLILLDLAMSGANGFDVLEGLRQSSELSQIPVVVFSGLECQTDISRAYALGAKLFLRKTSKCQPMGSYGTAIGSGVQSVPRRPRLGPP